MTLFGQPQWTWDTSTNPPTVTKYPSGTGISPVPTKSGVMPQDLQNFISIPIQAYGNPPKAIDPTVQLQWIRWAEDYIEQDSGLLLCQTWVASPPANTPQAAANVGIGSNSPGGYQKPGFDFDLADTAYDFLFARAQDEGWMMNSLRYKPLKAAIHDPNTPTALKLMSYNYPLLNEFFQVPNTWFVEDHDYGLIRLVPAVNVQMLPLFAMQLAFMGFAESVPGAIWVQYLAGITRLDYQTRFSFIPQLVLAEAARTALTIMQSSINIGALEYRMLMDGAQYVTKYDPNGPFAGFIRRYTDMRDELMVRVKNRIAGPVFSTI